jgi:hypothetical protein
MRTTFVSLATAILVLGCSGRSDRTPNRETGAAADQSRTDTMSSASTAPADTASTGGLTWGPAPPALPSGARVAVVSGDPTKAGPFTIRIDMPPDYAVRPHYHPTSEQLSVLEGTLHVGHGPKWDEQAMKEVPTGTPMTIAPKEPHFVHAASRVVLEVQSTGPFVITYVNPKDDPRTASTH